MNRIRIAALLVIMIAPFTAFAQAKGLSSPQRASPNKANKTVLPGFYFRLRLLDANSYAGWADEALRLFRASGTEAFDGDELPYEGITFEPFIPVRSLHKVEKPRRLKNVWVGPFETEETATSALEKFKGVLRPVLRRIKQEQAELQENADFQSFENWSIGAIKISGSEVEKPNSPGEEAAAMRDWDAFWTKFRAAVEKRDTARMLSLAAFSIWLDYRIVQAKYFFKNFNGDDELWKRLDESLATGAERAAQTSTRRPIRTSGDGVLVFCFNNSGEWRWRSVLSE